MYNVYISTHGCCRIRVLTYYYVCVKYVIYMYVVGEGQWLWESSGQETKVGRPPSWYIIVKKNAQRPESGGPRATLARGENHRRCRRLRPVAFATCSRQLVAESRQPSLSVTFHIIIKIIIVLHLLKKNKIKQLTITWQRRVWRSPPLPPPSQSSCTARSSQGSRRN